MASESKADDRSDEAASESLQDRNREVREELLGAIHDGPTTPLAQAEGDEVRRRHAAASMTPPSTPADEILAPLRREFEASGMTEEGLTHFLTEARDEVRRGKQTSEGS
jgi:hypothetical protein